MTTATPASGARPLLELHGVSGGYTKAPVLRDVDLTVNGDDVVGVLGANGAGKTTLLNAVAGTLPRLTGEVIVGGASMSRRPPWSRVKHGVALVPEGRHVFAQMTVQENLDVAAIVGRRARSCDEVYELFPRLSERSNQVAGSMSGGEQQMLAIGRALMTSPRMLLIDEMSAGLAPVVVEQLVASLVRLRGRGMGIVLVEQSPHYVAELVDRVCVMERGRIVSEGTLADLGGTDSLARLYLGMQ